MEVTIDSVVYNVSVLPPRLAPFNMLYCELLQKKPASLEEAKDLSEKIEELNRIILNATVSPVPCESHYTQLYNALTELTNQALSQTFFPERDRKNIVSCPKAESPTECVANSLQ